MVKGYLHFHILLDVKEDIRTGFDFELYQRSVDLRKQRMPYRHLERQAFRTANVQLRNLWATFRQVLPLYGFGRHELLPIRTTAEAAAKYVGKYVSKHLDARLDEDKGFVPIRDRRARQAFLVVLRGIRRGEWNGGASWAPSRIARGALTWTT